MNKLFANFKWSLACSVAYCVPAFFLVQSDKYSNSWLLYLGNVCFIVLLIAGSMFAGHNKDSGQTTGSMFMNAFKTEIAAIIISCLILAVFIFIFNDDNVLKRSPANTLGLYYMLPLSVILINIIAGSIAVFMWTINLRETEDNT